MSNVLENRTELKEIFKAAIVEVLEERGELVSDLLRDILEDAAFIRAIEAGEKTPPVSRTEIFNLLEKEH